LADTRRDQKYLGIDSNVLVAYLLPDHPYHDLTRSLAGKKHAINPTVLHETYHTCVFKLKRRPEDTVKALLEYMAVSLCLPINSDTVELGLKFALEHHLGGRDALILASYASSVQVDTFVTFDRILFDIKQLSFGRRELKIVRPPLRQKRIQQFEQSILRGLDDAKSKSRTKTIPKGADPIDFLRQLAGEGKAKQRSRRKIE
jgi:predicted nucleic acid-binding protein